MPTDVEINLRIPRMKVPALDEHGNPIDNSLVRFARRFEVPAIPKPGASLQLTLSSGHMFECEVTRVAWSERKDMFVVDCKYAKRSITPDECTALTRDPAWTMNPLL